ncbi:hypothetical protein A3Q34_12825 [Colwellia sp. PAMC 20917]|uniref:PEP-CTERM sorting domain-containing protein n=1 Tax=Colwellia sp. PAMC 20917 TaxID=1816218 RepID=UPI000878EBF4|nr:PEP-CTERM sorting domain-containing protein [Colwellia sp. PAMC 20917]AOW77657.1 hypothetical protein A3Q34_12825 [Colwellia sp. PAMC 20917]
MKFKFLKLAVIGLTLTIGGIANAGLIYDNGGPSTYSAYSIGSSETADDFILATAYDINSVEFYFQNFNGITGWGQDITYSFYNDNSGSIGSLIATGNGQNVTAVDSGLAWCCGGNAWEVNFDLASTISLNAGHYWLGLTGASGSSPWWVTTSAISGYSGKINGSTVANDFAFSLSSQDVPEPSTLAIFALGMIGLASRRFKKQ